MTFENIEIKGEIAQNEQFHLLLQYFQLFLNINFQFSRLLKSDRLLIEKQMTFEKSCEVMG